MIDVEFDDRSYTGAHFGHLCRAQVRLSGATLINEERRHPQGRGRQALMPDRPGPEEDRTTIVGISQQAMREGIHMRTVAALLLIVLGPAVAVAAPPEQEKMYYVGEAKLSSATGQAMGSQVILLEKVHDPESATIIEQAVVVHPDGRSEEFTMRMAVKDDNTFTLTDDARTTEGSGVLFGPAWQWTYFKATYKVTNGVRIDDENFLSDASCGTARKKLTGPDGKVFSYMDITLKSITPRTFEILRAGLMKK